MTLERQIDRDSDVKVRFKDNGEIDGAVTTKLSPGVDVTFCFGLDIFEHTQEKIDKLIKELEEENKKKVDEWKKEQTKKKITVSDKELKEKILVKKLASLKKSPGQVWATPYFGMNFNI